MDKNQFEFKFQEIISSIENTNYGSILGEFKLILLIQEFVLTNNEVTEEYLLTIFNEEMGKDGDNEARVQTLGELYMNINESHRCSSILNDLGKDYIEWLFQTLEIFKRNDSLFTKCNE